MQTTVQPIQIDLIENEPRVSAMVIADNTNTKYESIRDLIRKYKPELESFGEIPFTDFKSAKQIQGRIKQVAELNEQQSTLLITFLKNTKEVVEFKVNLVKAFFMMKERLQGNNQPAISEHTLTQILHSNQETTMAIVQMNKNLETMFKTMLDTNNNMVRLKSEVREKLEQTNHKLSNLQVSASASQNASEQTKDDIEEIKSVVEKLEVYHRRDTLDAEQIKMIQEHIKQKARQIADKENRYYDDICGTLYTRLKSHFQVDKYHEIKSVSFARALKYIDNITLTREDIGA